MIQYFNKIHLQTISLKILLLFSKINNKDLKCNKENNNFNKFHKTGNKTEISLKEIMILKII